MSLELKVPPPVATLALAGLMWIAARPLPLLGVPPARGAALGVAAVAVALFAVATLQFVARRTSINPLRPASASSLLTTGVYRLSRNPIYLADALLLVAWALWLGDASAWLAPPAFVAWMTRFQVVPEERALAERFGDAYERYRKRVRRWV